MWVATARSAAVSRPSTRRPQVPVVIDGAGRQLRRACPAARMRYRSDRGTPARATPGRGHDRAQPRMRWRCPVRHARSPTSLAVPDPIGRASAREAADGPGCGRRHCPPCGPRQNPPVGEKERPVHSRYPQGGGCQPCCPQPGCGQQADRCGSGAHRDRPGHARPWSGHDSERAA